MQCRRNLYLQDCTVLVGASEAGATLSQCSCLLIEKDRHSQSLALWSCLECTQYCKAQASPHSARPLGCRSSHSLRLPSTQALALMQVGQITACQNGAQCLIWDQDSQPGAHAAITPADIICPADRNVVKRQGASQSCKQALMHSFMWCDWLYKNFDTKGDIFKADSRTTVDALQ